MNLNRLICDLVVFSDVEFPATKFVYDNVVIFRKCLQALHVRLVHKHDLSAIFSPSPMATTALGPL